MQTLNLFYLYNFFDNIFFTMSVWSGSMFGDPHVVTLDGLHYAIDGLGEYWVIKSDTFWLEARTDLAWNNRREVINATICSAFAAQGLYRNVHAKYEIT